MKVRSRRRLSRGPVTGLRTHPGEILKKDFMEPVRLSANALATALGVRPTRITGIVNGERSVTADTALRLARYFGGEPDWWLRLQAAYDLSVASHELGKKLLAIEPRNAA